MILGVVLLARGIFVGFVTPILHILDLPLLATGMLYAGTSLVLSVRRDQPSVVLSVIVFGFLTILFGLFLFFNFGYSFRLPI